jgi:hypothetical protein
LENELSAGNALEKLLSFLLCTACSLGRKWSIGFELRRNGADWSETEAR